MFLATFLCLWKVYREKVSGEMEHLPQIPLRSHRDMYSLAHPSTPSSSYFLLAGRGLEGEGRRKEQGGRGRKGKEGKGKETAERKEQEGREGGKKE